MDWPDSIQLETRRLLLISVQKEDVDIPFDLYSDWNVAKNLNKIPIPYTVEDAHKLIKDLLQEHKKKITLPFFIRTKEENTPIGFIHLHHGQDQPEDKQGILGYSIMKQYWNQGYVTEAAECLLDYGYNEIGFLCFQASTLTSNEASVKVLKKLGFTTKETGFMEECLHGPDREHCRNVLEGEALKERFTRI